MKPDPHPFDQSSAENEFEDLLRRQEFEELLRRAQELDHQARTPRRASETASRPAIAPPSAKP